MNGFSSMVAFPLDRRPALGWILCLAAGSLVGLTVASHSPAAVLAMTGACAVAWVVLAYPILGVALLLASTCFCSFYEKLPGTKIGSIGVPDILLALLIVSQARAMVMGRRPFPHMPVVWFVLLHSATAIIQLGVSVNLYGREFFIAVREFKYVLYYLPAIVIVQVARDETRLKRLIGWALLVGAAVAVRAFAHAALQTGDAGGSAGDLFYALEELQGGAGMAIAYWTLCCTACLLLAGAARFGHVALLMASLLFVVIMFQRHMYVGVGFAFVVAPILLLLHRRVRFERLVALGFVALALFALLRLSGLPAVERYMNLTVLRASSLKGIEQQETMKLREEESRLAFGKILEHPLAGIGFGTAYRGSLTGFETEAPDAARLVHCSYLAVFLRLGVVGFVAFMAALLLTIRNGFTRWTAVRDPFLQAIALGNAIALTGLAIMSLGAPYFVKDWRVAAVGLMIGVQLAMDRIGGAGGREPQPAGVSNRP